MRPPQTFQSRIFQHSPHSLSRLLSQQLDHNKIASDGCYYLSKTSLRKLQTLDISHNLINENAAGHLANSNLPSLINLIICKEFDIQRIILN